MIIKDKNNILEEHVDLHDMVLNELETIIKDNKVKRDRVSLLKYIKNNYKLKNVINESIIDNLLSIIQRKGVRVTDHYQYIDNKIHIKDIGKFQITSGKVTTVRIHDVYLLKRGDKFYIDVIGNRKPIVGLDVGTSRMFVSSDEHVVKHLTYTKQLKEFNRAFEPIILKEVEKARMRVIEGLANYYKRNYEVIVIENLKTNDRDLKIDYNMCKGIDTHIIEAKIKMQTWHKFFKIIEEDDGVKVVRVPPEYTSQICNKCGALSKSSRNKTIWKCKECGHIDDADVNAAKNIRDRGKQILNGEKIDLRKYKEISKKNKKYSKYSRRMRKNRKNR